MSDEWISAGAISFAVFIALLALKFLCGAPDWRDLFREPTIEIVFDKNHGHSIPRVSRPTFPR